MLDEANSVQGSASWLQRVASAAPWCAVVGRPSLDLLTLLQCCEGKLLAVVPDLEVQQSLEERMHPWPPRLQLKVACVGAEPAVVDWFVFNDSRFDGSLPLEHWHSLYPNLRLVGHERRQQQALSHFLDDAFTARQKGLLVLVDEPNCCVAALQGLGVKLEQIFALAVLPVRGEIDQAVVEDVLPVCACLKAVVIGGSGCFWHLDVIQKLECVEEERDALLAERDSLIGEQAQLDHEIDVLVNERQALVDRVADCEDVMSQINAELDQVFELLGQSSVEPMDHP